MTGLAATLGLKIQKLDVTSAFLNGQLKEDVFMECLDCFNKTFELIIGENSDRDKSRKSTKYSKL